MKLDLPIVIEGKTKTIYGVGDGTVLVVSRDDITAGDGAKHDVIEGKAAASTRTTCNIFALLENNGVPTHFVRRGPNDVTFRARHVKMIPLELIVRRYATGSYLDRFPDVADGTRFTRPKFEVFEKDDKSHDPLLKFDFENGLLLRYVPNKKAAEALGGSFVAGGSMGMESLAGSRYADITPALLDQLRNLAIRIFEIIEEAWATVGGTYIDFKIECGFDLETGELVVADVIDSDSGRLRFGGVDGDDKSKESYRDGSKSLPELRASFDEVADLSERIRELRI